MLSTNHQLDCSILLWIHRPHGSAPVDDDDSPVEEMSPVKAKKPSKHALKAKKNYSKEKEAPKDWTKAKEIALCQA
ncbi:hypothetical protein Tco_0109360 [Tanacetum coccineum]